MKGRLARGLALSTDKGREGTGGAGLLQEARQTRRERRGWQGVRKVFVCGGGGWWLFFCAGGGLGGRGDVKVHWYGRKMDQFDADSSE